MTITPTSSTVTTYTDAEINYLDSVLNAVGVTSVTLYSSEANRDSNTSPGATFASSLNFKLGSTVSGVVMSGTVYARIIVSGVTLFVQADLVVGTNTIDLGVQGQLSAINGSLQTKPTLEQIEASTLLAKEATVATKASQTSVDAIPTNPLLTTDARLDNLDATVSSRLASSAYTTPPTSAQNATATRAELTTELGRIDVATSTRLATSGYTAPTTPPTVVQIRQELDSNSTKLDATVSSRLATSGYTTPPTVVAIRTEMDTNSTKLANLDTTVSSRMATFTYTAPDNTGISDIKAKTDTLVNTDLSTVAKETTSQSIKTQTDKMSFTGTDIKATLDGEKVVVLTNEDKLGYGLTTTERTDIRSDLERTGGKLDLTAKTTELNSAVTSIKGVDNKDITQVFNNTPTIDNAGVATAVRTELTPELALIDTNLDTKVSEIAV